MPVALPFFFHNAIEQVKSGAGPYFYLPKMQSHLEARWWNDVFVHAERTLDLPRADTARHAVVHAGGAGAAGHYA